MKLGEGASPVLPRESFAIGVLGKLGLFSFGNVVEGEDRGWKKAEGDFLPVVEDRRLFRGEKFDCFETTFADEEDRIAFGVHPNDGGVKEFALFDIFGEGSDVGERFLRALTVADNDRGEGIEVRSERSFQKRVISGKGALVLPTIGPFPSASITFFVEARRGCD